MPRRLSIPSRELLRIELYLIYSYDGEWEEEWRPLQGVLPIPEVGKEVMDQALVGWTKPLVSQLGIPPEGHLRKLPSRECTHKEKCSFYKPKICEVLSKDMPWCFEPDKTPLASGLTSKVIQMWREGVYVLVVNEVQ